ncbi:amylo-alpha-1,6-glucosidase [Longibacter salinarum]|uniref:Amylo-alpha-1,6-glucosidase n=1 Tax=Longibacter salinarum TaxID=1850348 RepID=A0A2A8D1X6_9BACT|nr:amylo-alpha-1,6-glucosidase [Longibacter salinarum]PEN14959.1 amylo-alpha-1,6-glucosidase [Longibacter salinarum]
MVDVPPTVPGQHYIRTTEARSDERTRVLKHGDTFAVFNHLGDIEGHDRSEFGLFHRDTRFLSWMTMRLVDDESLLLLKSAIRKDNALLTVDLMNPDIIRGGDVIIPHGTIHVYRSQVLWGTTCYSRVRIHNYGDSTVHIPIQLAFSADFADIFEVRGLARKQRGRLLEPSVKQSAIGFAYEGMDNRRRFTYVHFSPTPTSLTDTVALYESDLDPQSAIEFGWTVTCEVKDPDTSSGNGGPVAVLGYDTAATRATSALRATRQAEPKVVTSNEQFDVWVNRSLADLHMLQTETPHGTYPYAGVPWFSTPFGRDGILTAYQCLWFSPDVARGVLSYLAAMQAKELDDARDAEPGKILHETRAGEMASLGEVPFERYYGSVDVTPLFVMLAGAYYQRTGDRSFVKRLWPHIELALHWIDEYGDIDGDGFVEYERRSEEGLVQQGWKDSNDSVFHEDGRAAVGPIALCEVQGYVYAAKMAASRLASALGHTDQVRILKDEAARLADAFEDAFWCEDLSTYALALDGDNRPCKVRTSNAAHCLFSGISEKRHAHRVAETLLSEPGYTGWGLRTVASTEARYNPMSYHNGSIWPHDNAIAAAGLGRYGHRKGAAQIMTGLFDASQYFDLHRLPELFCGFTRRPDEGPTLYPQACLPQAWAAATPLLCLQACLGLEVNGVRDEVRFHDPYLPAYIDQIQINDLNVRNGQLDLLVTRYERDVGVRITRREGTTKVVVLK